MNRENDNDLPPIDNSGADSVDESEVARVFDAYLADLEAGRAVDPERLIADHPKIAGELRACLEVMSLADKLADDTNACAEKRLTDSRDQSRSSAHQRSVLSTLPIASGAPPRVQLRELPDDREPMVKPRSSEMPKENGASLGRFQLQGEIARGGMGAILKGRDVDLGRDLAIKVMLESHQGNPDVVNRFIEEAQIGGQLQHPGIVPVYELGAFPDRRPYFAMKLVKGRTLAALLHERSAPPQEPVGQAPPHADHHRAEIPPSPTSPSTEELPSLLPRRRHPIENPKSKIQNYQNDLPRFLAIFEQICQTMAYAHARGVIHRDLKPSNIMVGSFGEVQVMDWGLAKVLPSGGIADEAAAHPVHETVIATVRSGPAGTGNESQAGSVLGTPSYMAPEQARGEVEQIDERADVFGLGAILCEILTGRPPFVGSTREQIRSQASRGDLTDALARLDASGSDIELISLARACLAAEVERRPRNAGVVAAQVTSYVTGVQDRLRSAELARVEAHARADEETKRRALSDKLAQEAHARARIERSRRRRTVALAASVLITSSVVGGGWAYLGQQRAARQLATNRVVSDALADVERLLGKAQSADLGDVTVWFQAASAARHARDLLAQGEPDRALQKRVDTTLTLVEEKQATAQRAAAEIARDRMLLAELEGIRGNMSEHWDSNQTDRDYAAAFRTFGIDLERLDPNEAGRRIAQRSQPVELASFLDDWAMRRRNASKDVNEFSWRRLFGAANVADPDPWRVSLRDEFARDEQGALRRLAADDEKLAAQSPTSLVLLSSGLFKQGDRDSAQRVLRQAWRVKPDDFWVSYYLGTVNRADGSNDNPDDAGRFLSAAVAIRPGSFSAHISLGAALDAQGKPNEAIVEFRTALRLKPDDELAHNNLGISLQKQGKLEEAIAEHREALRLNPEFAVAHRKLGSALRKMGKLDEAIAALREALRLKPDFAEAHVNLGVALGEQGKLDEAIAEYGIALRLIHNSSNAHNNLDGALKTTRKLDEASADFRRSMEKNPHYYAHFQLGNALQEKGKLDEAIAEYREALRFEPDCPFVHYNLGNALKRQGKLDQAIAEHRQALRLTHDYAEAHCNLGMILEIQGKWNEALAEVREALRLKPKLSEPHTALGKILSNQGKVHEAIAEYQAALRIVPGDASVHTGLGNALYVQGKLDEAMAEYREAIRLKPDLPEAYNGLGGVLRASGKLNEAVAAVREALRLRPDDPGFHANFGIFLGEQGQVDHGIAEVRESLRLAPKNPTVHESLAQLLAKKGNVEEAIAECRAAVRLNPDFPLAHDSLGILLMSQGKLEEATAEFRATLRLDPDQAQPHGSLGIILCRQGELAQGIAEFRAARLLVRNNPPLAERIAFFLAGAEWQAAALARLPAILAGKAKLSDAAEMLGFAQLCNDKKLHAASARFWTEAFQAQPKLADDMQVQNRYNAACAAALAGCGQGKDDPPLDDTAKARWRKQALDWLKADLAAWSKILETGPQQARQSITQTLQYWKADPDLAGICDPAALAKLPADEQTTCRNLWSQFDALLAKTGAKPPP